MEENTIDLKKLLFSLKRRIWLIIIVPIISLVLASGYLFFFAQPVYQSDVLLYIWQNNESSVDASNSQNYSDLLYFSQLVEDYQVLIKSRLVTNEVADELGLDAAHATSLASRITVGTKNNTRHITITAEDSSATMAARIANTVASVFSEVVVETMNAGTVKIIDPAVVPESPSAPNTKMTLAISIVLGLMIGIGLALLVEMLDNTVRQPSDIEELTGYKMLGFVPLHDSVVASRGRRKT